MNHGEINLPGAKQLANSLKNKKMLTICDLNGNQFGEDGCQELKNIFNPFGDKKVLQSLRYQIHLCNFTSGHLYAMYIFLILLLALP